MPNDLSSAMRRRFEEFQRRDAEWLARQPHVVYSNSGVECHYMGRNGSAVQHGLILNPNHEYVRLTPMNSMGPASNAFLDIPLADLPAVISKLQSFLPPGQVNPDQTYVICNRHQAIGVDDAGNLTIAGITIDAILPRINAGR